MIETTYFENASYETIRDIVLRRAEELEKLAVLYAKSGNAYMEAEMLKRAQRKLVWLETWDAARGISLP